MKQLKKSNIASAPRKKFRGKRRYYRKIINQSSEFRLDIYSDSWWNYWHYHSDWPGYGNLGWRHRRQHIRALCNVFLKCAEQLMNSDIAFQIWISLDGNDAGQDAVFLHTENPHTDSPVNFDNVTWDQSECAEYFCEQLDIPDIRAGKLLGENDTIYLIYSPSIGESLE